MMTRFVAAAALVLAGAQDPIKTLPDNYKVVLDNEFVRVVRVHYDAGAILPDHVHPAGNTVYVYLSESDGVVFKHSGNINRAVTRPLVKPGAIRVATGPEEHHTVANESKKPSDFLRIFLKTEGDTARNTRRLQPEEASLENKQIRITRMKLEQHDVETIDAKAPALLIEWPSGDSRWIEAGTSTTVENHDARDVNLIRIDLLTKPK